MRIVKTYEDFDLYQGGSTMYSDVLNGYLLQVSKLPNGRTFYIKQESETTSEPESAWVFSEDEYKEKIEWYEDYIMTGKEFKKHGSIYGTFDNDDINLKMIPIKDIFNAYFIAYNMKGDNSPLIELALSDKQLSKDKSLERLIHKKNNSTFIGPDYNKQDVNLYEDFEEAKADILNDIQYKMSVLKKHMNTINDLDESDVINKSKYFK